MRSRSRFNLALGLAAFGGSLGPAGCAPVSQAGAGQEDLTRAVPVVEPAGAAAPEPAPGPATRRNSAATGRATRTSTAARTTPPRPPPRRVRSGAAAAPARTTPGASSTAAPHPPGRHPIGISLPDIMMGGVVRGGL